MRLCISSLQLWRKPRAVAPNSNDLLFLTVLWLDWTILLHVLPAEIIYGAAHSWRLKWGEMRSGFTRMAVVGSCQLGAQLAASLGCRPRCFGLSTWPTWASPQHSSQGTTRARTRMQELTKRLLPSITLADILLTRTSESTWSETSQRHDCPEAWFAGGHQRSS